MPWTAWIAIEAEDSPKEAIRRLYDKTRHPVTGKISDLTRVTSRLPAVAERIAALGAAVYGQTTHLTAREKEIVAYQNMSTRIMESLGTVTEPAG